MTRFNSDHYIHVRRERERQGLPVGDLNIELPDHPAVGRTILDRQENTTYAVESAHKHYYNGWCVVFLLRDENDSHKTMFWENINCGESTITENFQANKTRYRFL